MAAGAAAGAAGYGYGAGYGRGGSPSEFDPSYPAEIDQDRLSGLKGNWPQRELN